MDCSTPSFPVHYLPEFAQIHVCWVGDTIQPFHPLSPPSPALNLSRHKGLFQGIGFSHQVAKVLELQLQHQSFQWLIGLIRVDSFRRASLLAEMVKTHLQCRRPRFRKTSWTREGLPTPVFLPGEFHGQRSQVGYSPWGPKESETTEWISLFL